MQKIKPNNVSKFYRPGSIRYFTTGVKDVEDNTETIIEEQDYYTPTKTINIDKGSFTVFDNDFAKDRKYVAPYEIKETVAKNSIGIIATLYIENGIS